ncbi:MAG: FG-GAP repeat domain-containing protein [Akkermansiaceae bacterium]
MKPLFGIFLFFAPFSLLMVKSDEAKNLPVTWKKHTIVDYKKGANTSVTAGDYNNDGKIDVISSYAGEVILFTAPDWKSTVIHELEKKGQKAISCVSLDVDQDGDLDWIGADAHAGAIWLENPSQAGVEWKARTVNDKLGGIHSIILADVNNDQRMDVLINNFKDQGKLAHSAMWYEVPEDPHEGEPWKANVFADGDAQGGNHYFGFGDIDGDGWGEIALGAKGAPFENGNWFAYWKNPGVEAVKQAWQKEVLLDREVGATNILIKDVNGDGKNDFICSNGHGIGIFWLEAPKWDRHNIDQEMECPHSLTAADFDGDGDLDVASCGFKSERVSVYYNEGNRKFNRVDIDDKQQSYDLHSVDIDGDGDLDLINAGRGTSNVVWYENPQK